MPRVYKPSFAGGEISPEMFGRIDDAKYQNGAASLENLIATPLGPAEKRPGFEYVCTTKNNGVARLIPFIYSTTQTMVIEMGDSYFRFHTDGETLLYSTTQPAFIPSGIVSFTIANPTEVTWTGHGLTTGAVVQFFIASPNSPLKRMPAGIMPGYAYTISVVDANTFTMTDATGNAAAVTAAPVGAIIGYPYHSAGDLVSYGGNIYYYNVSQNYGDTDANPASDGFWTQMPSSLIYELVSVYAAADLFDIHYVQSNDIVTLVHPNYPPYELRRLGATQWSFTRINFGAFLSPPASVSVTSNPGFLAQIASFSGSPSLVSTVSNHTLALGDPVYLKGISSQDGFYLVAKVPIDGTGALIPNELYLMDLSGNNFVLSGSYAGGATLQYGSQIFNITNFYVVTTIAADSIQESSVSAEVSVLNNLNVTGSYNTITWAAVPNAFRYFIYKKLNGLYGYIGETTAGTLTFNDNNIAPDFSITPPTYDTVFNSTGNFPGAVTYFQQRRCFAGTAKQPQNLWMSKTGTESDFSYSLPVKDTDRIAIGVASRSSSTIRHLIPLNQLVLMTTQSEISVSPTNTDTITPSTIAARPQSYIGSSNVQPTIVNNSLVYCANRGGHVREMGYQWQVGGYITGDISLRAAHLFDNLTIVDQAFMKAPWQIVWFVSSNGLLLGLTYIPEEQVGAWHHHVTDGTFESVACVAEGVEDRLYAVINRTVNGATVRYIERMGTRNFDALPDCFFVDSGANYNGQGPAGVTLTVSGLSIGPPDGTYGVVASSPIYDPSTDVGSILLVYVGDVQHRLTIITVSSTTTARALPDSQFVDIVHPSIFSVWSWARPVISGLDWLEGKTVAILADGAVQPKRVVTGGAVSIQRPSSNVTIGLPYTAELETLPLVLQIDGAGQGRQKNINKAWVRCYRSSGIFAGPSPTNLVQFKQRTTEPYGLPPNLITDEIQIDLPASWQDSGQIYVQHSDPLPLTIVGLTIEAALGG